VNKILTLNIRSFIQDMDRRAQSHTSLDMTPLRPRCLVWCTSLVLRWGQWSFLASPKCQILVKQTDSIPNPSTDFDIEKNASHFVLKRPYCSVSQTSLKVGKGSCPTCPHAIAPTKC